MQYASTERACQGIGGPFCENSNMKSSAQKFSCRIRDVDQFFLLLEVWGDATAPRTLETCSLLKQKIGYFIKLRVKLNFIAPRTGTMIFFSEITKFYKTTLKIFKILLCVLRLQAIQMKNYITELILTYLKIQHWTCKKYCNGEIKE